MTVHMWNDEQVDVFCGDDSDAPLDFVTRERVDDVTCHACLRAAIEFGERCINRLEHLRDPGCGPDTTFGYRRVVPPAGKASREDLERMRRETDNAIDAVVRSELARACDEIWKRSKP